MRSAVSICLNNRFPIVLYWGQQFVALYNDAYISILGEKHPWALGKPFEVAWVDIWDVQEPVLKGVMETGIPSWSDDQLLIMQRHGYAEETYFTYSFGAGRDEQGEVAGIFCAVAETTQRVLHERRLAVLRELTADAKSSQEAAALVAQILNGKSDIPFALVYLLDQDGRTARLASHTGLPSGHLATASTIDLAGDHSHMWPLTQAVKTGTMEIVADVDRRFGPLPGRPWPEPTSGAAVLSLQKAGQSDLAGFLILGVSPRRYFDDSYQRFFELVAGHVATMIANARAYEEERKRAEALAEIDRAKTVFFSNVSHEFRTPLTLMLGPLEDALANVHGILPMGAARDLTVAHRNSLRLLKLVNTLLDFSRIEAGRIHAKYEPIDLAAFTAELASNFRSACDKAGLRLLVDCPRFSSSEEVYIDRDMWEKIVLNLLSNAFKFTFEGEIEVSLRDENSPSRPSGLSGDKIDQTDPRDQIDARSVTLRVRDTGVGISAEELPRMFERFHRVEDSRGRTHEGTGIGLALVQELVRLHGGTVHVDSILGMGSTFTVTIPFGHAHLDTERIGKPSGLTSTGIRSSAFVEEALRWLPSEATSSELEVLSLELAGQTESDNSKLSTQHSKPSQTRPRVLLADDNADMREYVSRLLRERFNVEAVVDGEAALDAARANPPDLILTDIMMPRLDGFGLLRALRNDPATKTIPVILLSARAGEESRVEGLEHGADDYLIKPFSARELLARVHGHLDMACVRREAEAEIRDRGNRLNLLYDLASTVNGADSLELIHDKALDAILCTLKADRASILLFDEQGVMQFQAWKGLSETYRRAVTGHSPWKQDETAATPIVIEDVAASNIDTALKTVILEEGIHAMAFVPLTSPGRIIGKFMVYFDHPWRLDDEDLGVAQGIADTLATGIERKRAEQALRESEERFRLLADSAPVLMWMNGPEGAEFCNQAYIKFVGVSRHTEVTKFDWVQFVHPEDRVAYVQTYLKAVEARAPFDAEFRFRRHDGEYRWMRSTAMPRFSTNGEWLGYTGATFDITESKSFSDYLETLIENRTRDLVQSQDRLRALASEVNLAEQRERKRLATELHDHLQQMLVLGKLKLGQGKRLAETTPLCAKLINETDEVLSDALQYTRTLVAELSPPALRDHGLAAGLKWLGDNMKKHDMAVTVTVAEGAEIDVPEDRSVLLFQSVRELLINASKHAGTHEACVKLEQRDGQLVIEVKDNGIGFDLAAADTPNGDLTSKFGLFSIKERMKALGGTFDIRSVPGQGTMAMLTLPFDNVRSFELSEAVNSKSSTQNSTRPSDSELITQNSQLLDKACIRLLLVDDHAMVRQGLRSVLDAYEDVDVVGEASDGEEAMISVERLQPSIVVMDINMPKMNGIEATAQIKARYPHILIIGLSVNVEGENADLMKKAGAAVLLTKEAAVDELYRVIQEALKGEEVRG